MAIKKDARRLRIKRSIRSKISGTAQRPRMSVFRSNRRMYVQLIDDVNAVTLASVSSLEVNQEAKNSANIETATQVGKMIAQKAQEKGIETVVFDRNGYLYHGKIKALAEGARSGGLKF